MHNKGPTGLKERILTSGSRKSGTEIANPAQCMLSLRPFVLLAHDGQCLRRGLVSTKVVCLFSQFGLQHRSLTNWYRHVRQISTRFIEMQSDATCSFLPLAGQSGLAVISPRILTSPPLSKDQQKDQKLPKHYPRVFRHAGVCVLYKSCAHAVSNSFHQQLGNTGAHNGPLSLA